MRAALCVKGSSPSAAVERTHRQSVKTPLRKSVGVTGRTSSSVFHPPLATSSGAGTSRRGRVVEDPTLALRVKRRDHGEDHLAVLHGDDVAGRERTPVPVTVHFEHDGQIAPSRPQEVAVERVGQAPGLHGGRRGEQTLRRHLPAVERLTRSVVGVATAEEVTIDSLEGEQGREVLGAVELRHPRAARTQCAHVSMRRQNSSQRPAKLCMCPILGQTKRSTLRDDS